MSARGAAPRRLAAALALAVARAAAAGSAGDAATEWSPLPPGSRYRVALEEDNDAMSLARRTTDDLYTQGARVSFRWAAGEGADDVRELGVVVGQEIYTPTEANLTTRDLASLVHDRPYAGWLYAALLLRWGSPTPLSLSLGDDGGGRGQHATELLTAVGVTGRPSAAAEFQEGFHALLHEWSGGPSAPISPAGWAVYQTATQATLDTSLRTQLDVAQAAVALGGFTAATGSLLGATLSPRARLDVGSTLDAASVGLELRAGLLAPRWRRWRPPHAVELWGYARADGRFVLYNGFIQGPLAHAVTPLVDVEPWVADLAVGGVLRVGQVEVGFAQLWRTREFVPSPPGARGLHEVGQVTVAWTIP